MDFEVLYRLDFGSFQWHVLLIPISLIILGVYATRLIKRQGFKHPMQALGFFPDLNLSLIRKFFTFIFAFFGFILLIVMLVQIPIGLIERRTVKEIIKNDNYKTIEGQVENFSPADNEDKRNESFEISGVRFSYSEFDDFYGYSSLGRQLL